MGFLPAATQATLRQPACIWYMVIHKGLAEWISNRPSGQKETGSPIPKTAVKQQTTGTVAELVLLLANLYWR